MDKDGNTEALTILRAVLALGRRLRQVRPDGSLPLSALGVLVTIGRKGPLLATELAAAEHLQPQSLTRIVARLEAENLIVRERCEKDRRAITISLSAKGRAVLGLELQARQKWLDGAMRQRLDSSEQSALLAAAQAMLKLAGEDGPGVS